MLLQVQSHLGKRNDNINYIEMLGHNMVYRGKFHVLLTMIMERLILFLFDTALVALAIWFMVEMFISIC